MWSELMGKKDGVNEVKVGTGGISYRASQPMRRALGFTQSEIRNHGRVPNRDAT